MGTIAGCLAGVAETEEPFFADVVAHFVFVAESAALSSFTDFFAYRSTLPCATGGTSRAHIIACILGVQAFTTLVFLSRCASWWKTNADRCAGIEYPKTPPITSKTRSIATVFLVFGWVAVRETNPTCRTHTYTAHIAAAVFGTAARRRVWETAVLLKAVSASLTIAVALTATLLRLANTFLTII